jgi:hypothetical protein
MALAINKAEIMAKAKKVLGAARKHLLSLLSGVVAIAACVLAFYPTTSWYTALQAKVVKSASAAGTVQTILTHERHLPNVSLKSGPTPVLSFFPTQDVIDKGKAAVNKMGDLSRQMLAAAVQINVHAPLADGAFPNGNDVARQEFVTQYLAALADDTRIRNWPPKELQSRQVNPVPPLMPGRKVTDADVQAAKTKLQNDINAQTLIKDTTGAPTLDSKAMADALFAQQSAVAAAQLQMDRAHQCKVYMEAGAIQAPAVYTQFQNLNQSPALADIWTAQVVLWVDEDVATGVATANADATDVTNAPIKQIVKLIVKDPPYLIAGDPNAGKDDQPIPPNPDISPTGRASNGMYDVILFNLSLDVDAGKVADVLDGLEKGQFITVLAMQASSVDGAKALNLGFVYGKGAVVHLDLACEELFLHPWISKYQPATAGAAVLAGGANGAAGGAPAPSTPIFPVIQHAAVAGQ